MSPAAHTTAQRMERDRLPDWKLSYRIDELCAATGYGRTKIKELIASKKLKAKKDGAMVIISRTAWLEYLDSLPDWQATAA